MPRQIRVGWSRMTRPRQVRRHAAIRAAITKSPEGSPSGLLPFAGSLAPLAVTLGCLRLTPEAVGARIGCGWLRFPGRHPAPRDDLGYFISET
jgi:hypothetical protein